MSGTPAKDGFAAFASLESCFIVSALGVLWTWDGKTKDWLLIDLGSQWGGLASTRTCSRSFHFQRLQWAQGLLDMLIFRRAIAQALGGWGMSMKHTELMSVIPLVCGCTYALLVRDLVLKYHFRYSWLTSPRIGLMVSLLYSSYTVTDVRRYDRQTPILQTMLLTRWDSFSTTRPPELLVACFFKQSYFVMHMDDFIMHYFSKLHFPQQSFEAHSHKWETPFCNTSIFSTLWKVAFILLLPRDLHIWETSFKQNAFNIYI